MKGKLVMDFTVDETTNTVNISREFNAGKDLVWRAWTEAKMLDQWWAPKPYVNKTKSMDFTEGGRWLYSMTSPEGESHLCFVDYFSISEKENFKYKDAFCDSEGNITDFPDAKWNIRFTEKGGHTMVSIQITHDSAETLQKYLEMGFKEGFTTGLNQLGKLLATLK